VADLVRDGGDDAGSAPSRHRPVISGTDHRPVSVFGDFQQRPAGGGAHRDGEFAARLPGGVWRMALAVSPEAMSSVSPTGEKSPSMPRANLLADGTMTGMPRKVTIVSTAPPRGPTTDYVADW
jgi:hypothetical protein